MGGCCSAQGTADGSHPSPGAPAARDKAKAVGMHPAEAKSPAKPEEKKAAPPAKTAPAAPQPPEAKKTTEPTAEGTTKEEERKKQDDASAAPAAAPAASAKPPAAVAEAPPKAPPAASAGPAHDKPPMAQSDRAAAVPPLHESSTTPPTLPTTATPEQRAAVAGDAPPHLKAEEVSTGHGGNSPTSTLITRAFPSLEELKATPPPPPSLEPPAEKASATDADADADADAAVPAAPPVEFSLPAPPATLKASPVNLTPERAQPPRFAALPSKDKNVPGPRAEADDEEEAMRTRGTSTARVEEVPPTPARESDVATGKALPADDARVLQRVPPPPPPPMLASASSAQETPKAAEAEEKEEEEAKPAEAANPLADILRRQQEEKQRYPTALTTDAADDAPLEISMEEDKTGAVAANVAAAAGMSPASAAVATATAAAAAAAPTASATVQPLAEPGTVLAFPAATNEEGEGDAAADASANLDHDAASHGGLVYKVLQRQEWEELCKSGSFLGNADDRADGYVKFTTADQALDAAAAFAHEQKPLVLICCTLEALAKPDARAAPAADKDNKAEAVDDDDAAAPALRWESAPLLGQRTPRLYRPLHRRHDILWYEECANGAAVLTRLRREVVAAESGSADSSSAVDADENQEDDDRANAEPEKLVFRGYEDDVANKPISFTDTSEIERQLAEKDEEDGDGDDNGKDEVDGEDAKDEEKAENEGEEDEASTPRMTPPTEQNNNSSIDMPTKAHGPAEVDYDDDLIDEDDDDKPQPIVKDVVPDIDLAPSADPPVEAKAPQQHTVAAMTAAPEAAGPLSPRDEHHAVAATAVNTTDIHRENIVAGLVPPRRVPPPLPSPPAEEAQSGLATPPPTRAAPPTILSPPPA